MNDDLKAYVAILLVCSCFFAGAVYFFLLYRFAKYVKMVNMQIWLSAQKLGTSRESLFQTSYRIISTPAFADELMINQQLARMKKNIMLSLGIALILFGTIFICGLYVSVVK